MKDKLIVLAEFLVDQFKKELEGQDHKASGDLESSLRYEINETGGGFEINFIALNYGRFLETGTTPHYVPIDALIKWIEDKGIAFGDKEIKNMAFAIQKTIAQEGTPTKGSYSFTKNGRKKEWISFVANSSKPRIEAEILKAMSLTTSIRLANIIKETNKSTS